MNYGKLSMILAVISLLFVCSVVQPALAYNSSLSGSGEVGVKIIIHNWPIHPTNKDGGKDIKEMLEAENGGSFSGSVGPDDVAFYPSANSITVGSASYPSAYIMWGNTTDNPNHNLSKPGKDYEVSFKVPTGMDFGLRLKGNRSGDTTITVKSTDGSIFSGSRTYPGNGNERYYGSTDGINITSDNRSAIWFHTTSDDGDYLTITLSGRMGTDSWTTDAYLQCQIYYKPTVSTT